jgi:hypothetical protein
MGPNAAEANQARARWSTCSWYHAARIGAARALVLRVSLLCSALLVLACGAPSRAIPPAPTPPPAPPPVKREAWPGFAEVRSWPPAAAPFSEVGHAGAGRVAVVRVSPTAQPTYEHLTQDSVLPEGTVLALFHDEATARPGPVYVMEKRSGKWAFGRLGPDGTILGDAAELGRCARCHRDGVADGVFGLPHPRGD